MVSSLKIIVDSLDLVSTRIIPPCAQVLMAVVLPPDRSRLTVSSLVPACAAVTVSNSNGSVRTSMGSLLQVVGRFYPGSARPGLGARGGLGGEGIVRPIMLGIAAFELLFDIQ